MKIVALNIQHGGGTRIRKVLAFLQTHSPDAVVLTEFRENHNARALRAELASQGLGHFAAASSGARENSVAILAKRPFASMTFPSLAASDKHRILSARFKGFTIYGVYFAQRKAKASLFQFLLDRAYNPSPGAYFVVGDFNTGLHKLDEAGSTFFCAEQFATLSTCGLIDSWRSRNLTERVYSWYSSRGNGFRIDHVFSSPEADARIKHVYFDHALRESRATDHSALVIEYDS